VRHTALPPQGSNPRAQANLRLSRPSPALGRERAGLQVRALPSMLNASQLAAAERLPLFRALLAAPPIHGVEFDTLSGLEKACGDLCRGMPERLVSNVGSQKRGDPREYDRN
jgi:hypothetical protein